MWYDFPDMWFIMWYDFPDIWFIMWDDFPDMWFIIATLILENLIYYGMFKFIELIFFLFLIHNIEFNKFCYFFENEERTRSLSSKQFLYEKNLLYNSFNFFLNINECRDNFSIKKTSSWTHAVMTLPNFFQNFGADI